MLFKSQTRIRVDANTGLVFRLPFVVQQTGCAFCARTLIHNYKQHHLDAA